MLIDLSIQVFFSINTQQIFAKLACLLFFTDNLNSETTTLKGDREGKAYLSVWELGSVERTWEHPDCGCRLFKLRFHNLRPYHG